MANNPAYDAVYHGRRRAEERAYSAAYRKAHREENRAYMVTYNEARREKARAYYLTRQDIVHAAYLRRREDRRIYNAMWAKKNIEARHSSAHARRARLAGNGGSHTIGDWLEKVDLFAGCCVYCGDSKPLTRDHNVPLSRGGTNDIGNVLPACLACNLAKARRTANEYINLLRKRKAIAVRA